MTGHGLLHLAQVKRYLAQVVVSRAYESLLGLVLYFIVDGLQQRLTPWLSV